MSHILFEALDSNPIDLDGILSADRQEVQRYLRAQDVTFISKLHRAFGAESSLERAAMCRLLRRSLEAESDIETLMDCHFEMWLVRSLEIGANRDIGVRSDAMDETSAWERKQAFRCIARIFDVCPRLFGAALTKSLIAVASQREDRLRALAVELLRNVLLSNPQLVAECDGTKLLFDAVVDPSLAFLAEPLMLSLLSVLNRSESRLSLRPFHDVQSLLAPFTDIDFKFTADQAEVWAASRQALVLMLRSWAGIVILSSDSHGLSSVLRLLKDHAVDSELQFAVLDLVVDSLHPVFKAFRRDLPKAQSPHEQHDTLQRGHYGIVAEQTYAAVLCSAFIHCGLVEGLTFLGVRGEDSGETSLRSRAIDILANFLVVVARIFPEDSSVEFLSMPEVLEVVSGGSFGSERDRRRASSNAQMMLVTLATSLSSENVKGSGWAESPDGPDLYAATKALVWESGEQHDSSMTYDAATLRDIKPTIDRKIFLSQMEYSQVNSTKEWRHWKWDVIRQLLEETLTQQEHFVDALKNHKWIKRVCGFFRCDAEKERDKAFFAALPWEIKHMTKLDCARLLFTILLKTYEGKQYLQTDRRGSLFPEILREIEKVVQCRPSVFDEKTCSVTMAREFITLLGYVSTLPFGRDFIEPLLEKKKKSLEQLGKKHECDFLGRLLLLNFDFTIPEWTFPRDLVSTWLNGGASRFLRLCINSTIRDLIRETPARLLHPDLLDWAIHVLDVQFVYHDLAVVEGAVETMMEAVSDPEFLAFFVDKFPFEKLGNGGIRPLTNPSLEEKLRMLKVKLSATKTGFEKLQRMGWVNEAVSRWQEIDERNYGRKVEASFSKILGLRPDIPHNLRTIPLQRPHGGCINEEVQFNHGEVAAVDRVPWSIILRLRKAGSGSDTPISTKVTVHRVDTDSEGQILFRVRGTVLGEGKMPEGRNLEHSDTVAAALFLGSYEVNPDGSLRNLGDVDQRDSKKNNYVDSAPQLVKHMESDARNWVSCHPMDREHIQLSSFANGQSATVSPAESQTLWRFSSMEGSKKGIKTLEAVEFVVSAPTLSTQFHAHRLHLYGELARTAEGCAFLGKRAVISSLVEQCGDASCPAVRRFDSLLGLGQIGASETGFGYLLTEKSDIMEALIELAVDDDDLSIRGAAFCALGLWSHSISARDHLQRNKWSCTGDPLLSISLPRKYSSIFNLSAHRFVDAPKEDVSVPKEKITNSEEREIVDLLEKLACSIYQKDAKDAMQRY
jgi:hypothetical protein